LIWLVLGGARSGKSVVAERLASGLVAPVTYVATMVVGGADDMAGAGEPDPDLAARVQAHRDRRPNGWRTIEVGAELELTDALMDCVGTVLLDSLGPWVASSMSSAGAVGAADAALESVRMCAALRERTGDTVVVSEEVGFGVHPSSAQGRQFRDALGALNQAVSAMADEAYFVIAGRVLRLDDHVG
jgi:adenosyl cobinamide kinase/adenosyl cobinamide phosphate guanylyltransferase